MQDNLIVLPSRVRAASGQPTKHLLPAPLTSFLGRQAEIAATCALLRRADVRLLTLTGTGGVGKTRLALQIAEALADDFFDGIIFIPLAPISDPTLVVTTLAQSLHLKESEEDRLLEHLYAYLWDKQHLLLLDNFEQIVEAAPLLVELLQGCPGLKMLVTSRARLRVSGEHEFPVQPLAVPGLDHSSDSDALTQYPAVALFVQRAQGIKQGFQFTHENARVIAQICRKLDGLPLAIELAAARIKLLSPQALLSRLSHRLQVLIGGVQDAPVRHQTLRNTIAWSYDLLSAADQQLFRRLSVFVDGCTMEAVEAIGGVTDILERVESLLDKSLLQLSEQEGMEPRFLLLETVREFGLECLSASGEEEMTRQLHALHYLWLAEEAESKYGGPEHALWFKLLWRENDNIRAAMQWSLEQGERDSTLEVALRLGGALREYWSGRDQHGEGRAFLHQVLDRSTDDVSPVRAKALMTEANLAIDLSDFAQGEALARKGLSIYRSLGDARGQALSLHMLQRMLRTTGDYAQARALAEDALTLFHMSGDRVNIAWSYFRLARLERLQGNYARACELFEANVAVHRALGNKEGTSYALMHLAEAIFASQGDLERARALLDEGVALIRELDYGDGIGVYLYFSAQIALSQGDIATARALAEELALRARELDDIEYLAAAAGCPLDPALHDQPIARGSRYKALSLTPRSRAIWLIGLPLFLTSCTASSLNSRV